MPSPLRFGILGAARIAPNALIKPARAVSDAQVVAVAARDVNKARTFAQTHHIPRVLDSYDALVNDPDIDAIYNPLPNALHYEWTIKALRAGKHVLCEKPLASNAREAEEMARIAAETGLVLMEAFHYRYHPLMQRVQEIVANDEIGMVREMQADFFIPLFLRPKDIRFNYALAGGGAMDTGCYCINFLRAIAGTEPAVTRAAAREMPKQIDRVMHAEFRFENGVTAKMGCSLAGLPPIRIFARVCGDAGAVEILNPFIPHRFHSLTVRTASGKRTEYFSRKEHFSHEPTYNFQLRAFVAATRGENTNLTDAWDGVKNMRVIDAVYAKSGLKVRGT
ncbi:MAG: Gfo/Idh/MocA family oxidoreductase [Chloroflexi bacterium]|nr:Gfo/Idh/MocA family oxidoreductase [Chloroflexota bacterium]